MLFVIPGPLPMTALEEGVPLIANWNATLLTTKPLTTVPPANPSNVISGDPVGKALGPTGIRLAAWAFDPGVTKVAEHTIANIALLTKRIGHLLKKRNEESNPRDNR
jgi:hypothetical protein